MDFTWEEYQKKLETYRKNRENVPLETLKTKYAKGYNKLKSDLKKMTEEILCSIVVSGMIILKEDCEPGKSGMAVIDGINRIIEKEKDAGTMKEIGRAVFRDYDIEKAMDITAERIWRPAWYRAYGPYWESKCRTENGITVCSLLPGFTWDEECGLWLQEEDGKTVSFTTMLPPPMDLIRKEEMRCRTQ